MAPRNKLNIQLIAGFGILICLLSFYLSPLLRNLDKSFTLFPKNIPSWYSNLMPVVVTADPVLKSHRLPLWVPLLDGGRPYQEYPVYEPFGLVHLLAAFLNENAALKIYWCLFFLAGACAMFYLTYRVLDLTMIGSLYSALVFSMSGAFAYLFENGFQYCRELLLLPLLMALFIKGETNKKFLFGAALVLSWIMIHSALYLPVLVLFFFAYSVFRLSFKGGPEFLSSLRPLRNFALLCCLAVALSAFKLIPLMAHLSLNNRISGLDYAGAITQANTAEMFFRRIFSPENCGAGTMYLGLWPVLAAFIGIVFYFHKMKVPIALLLLFIALSFGPNAPVDLHRALWHLPFFRSISEIAKYYSVFIVFLIAILSGAAFSCFKRKPRSLFFVLIPWLLFSATYSDLLKNSRYFNVFDESLKFKSSEERMYHVRGLNLHQGDESLALPLMYFFYKNNIGLLWPQNPSTRVTRVVPRYFLLPKFAFMMPYTGLMVLPNPAYKGEAYFLLPSNSVKAANFSPNRIDLSVAMAQAGDRVVINQNYDPHWKASCGILENYDGLMSLRITDGFTGSISLRYFPGRFYAGSLISLSALAFCGYFLLKKRNGACLEGTSASVTGI